MRKRTLEPWSLIAPDAPMDSLIGQTLLITGSTRETAVVVVEVRHPEERISGELPLDFGPLGATRGPRSEQVSRWRRLNDVARSLMDGLEVAHVVTAPGVLWGRRGLFTQRATAVRRERFRDELLDNRHVLQRLQSLAGGSPDGAGGMGGAPGRVERIKEELGALQVDIAYRIENSALFDGGVELTRAFQVLLMRWDDTSGRLDPAALERLSREVEVAFTAARRHAEAVGLSHLPHTARDDAGRAVKAAHLAGAAGTEGERAAALEQVNRILASLALYYLPAPAEATLALGGSRPQVEG